jgi:hypothetical protein
MSIINQALKKAQRERLLHETQSMRHLSRLTPARPLGHWLLMAAGGIVVLVAGTVLLPRLLVPTRPATIAPSPRLARQQTPVDLSRKPSVFVPATQPSRVAAVRREIPDVTLPRRHSAQTEGRVSPPKSVPPRDRDETRTPGSRPTATAAVPAGPRARDLFNQALESQKDGQQERALTLLQQAVKLDPELKEGYNSLGNLFYQQHKYNQARSMYEKALAIDPTYVKARNNLGSTYLQLAMNERAREEFHKAIEADRTYGLAYYNLACAYARTGDRATAVRYLQKAISIEPQARTWARNDDDFARIRTAPKLQQLLGPS